MMPRPFVFLFILALAGCAGPAPDPDDSGPHPTIGASPAELGQSLELTRDALKLDALCWYVSITKNLSPGVANPVTVMCRKHGTGVADQGIYVESATVTDAVAQALAKAQAGEAPREAATSLNERELEAVVATIRALNERCWYLRFEKNAGWRVTGKSRGADELHGHTGLGDGPTLGAASDAALAQLKARGGGK